MIQLSSGRLLFTGYWERLDGIGVHPDWDYTEKSAWGLWRGERIQVEGHGHSPEMGISMVFRSDDDGQSWEKHRGGLMGWFDFEGNVTGMCGQTSCFEPTIAETGDGNVLLIARSTVGRLVQSFSTNGADWNAVIPTELAASEQPAMMITLPESGDLLIVWNQLSREEIRRGYRLGRLSAAISKNGGRSWQNFRTIELSEGLEDVDRVPPEYPIQMVRARDWVGTLPDGWRFFHYANLDVVAGKVFLRYLRSSAPLDVAEYHPKKQETVMRVYPLDYFYE